MDVYDRSLFRLLNPHETGVGMKPRKFRIVIEYDGTDFAGWQMQPGRRTVQEEIEKAIELITASHSRVIGSGRTDAGVHARKQVAHFLSEARLDPEEWIGALNATLPKDIKVLDAAEVDSGFDARRNAAGKWYRYKILNRRIASPIERNRVWHVPSRLDIKAMRKAARLIKGERDFRSFQGSGCASENTVRTIKRLGIKYLDEDHLVFDIVATAFMKYMVRNIVGTLIAVGQGKIKPEEIKNIIRSRDRRRAGPTAPPQGLTLMEVYYNKKYEIKRKSRRN